MNNTQQPSIQKAIQQMNLYKNNFEVSQDFWIESMSLFREILTEDLVHGRCVNTMYSGCVYLLAKQREPTITPSCLADLCPPSVNETKILRASRKIQRETEHTVTPISVDELLESYFEELEFNEKTEEKCVSLLGRCREKNIVSGKSPRAVAAGLLYISGLLNDEGVSQQQISQLTGMSEITIRNRYKEQADALELTSEVEKAKKKKTP